MECLNKECPDYSEASDSNCRTRSTLTIDLCLTHLKAHADPVAEVPCGAGLDCPIMEECQYVDWQKRDKDIMADALREIYNIRGEDKDIERIVNEALDRGCAI